MEAAAEADGATEEDGEIEDGAAVGETADGEDGEAVEEDGDGAVEDGAADAGIDGVDGYLTVAEVGEVGDNTMSNIVIKAHHPLCFKQIYTFHAFFILYFAFLLSYF